MKKLLMLFVLVLSIGILFGCGISESEKQNDMVHLFEVAKIRCMMESGCEEAIEDYTYFESYIASDRIDQYREYESVKVHLENHLPVKVVLEDSSGKIYQYSGDSLFIDSEYAREKETVEKNAVAVSLAADNYCKTYPEKSNELTSLSIEEISEHLEGGNFFDFYVSTVIYLKDGEFDYVEIHVSDGDILKYDGSTVIWSN